MLKSIERLLSGEKKVGNHRREDTTSNGKRITKFFYHATAVCTVCHANDTFCINNGGWGTSSTTRAINDYRDFLVSDLYNEVFDNFNKMVEQLVAVPMGHSRRCYFGSLESPKTTVTITKRTIADLKFAEITVANEDFCQSYTIRYTGSKTLEKQIKEQIGHHFL